MSLVLPALAALFLTLGCQSRGQSVDKEEPVVASVAALSSDAGTDSNAGPASPSIGSFALYATEAMQLNSDAIVTGCNVGVEKTSGPFLAGGVAAYFNAGATIQSTQTLYAYSTFLNSGASVGPIDTNSLTTTGSTTHGAVSTFPAMPAPPPTPAATAGTTAVTLNSGATKTLTAGAYGSVTLNSNAKLALTGGTYVFSSLTIDNGAMLSVTAATTLSVTGAASFNGGSFAGPAAGSGLTAKSLVMYFDGSSPISLNNGAQIQALLIATSAAVTVVTSQFTGAIAAAQVVLNSGARVTCQDGFGSLVPTNLCAGVTCTALDACHGVGTCSPSTGVCSNPALANGTSCTGTNLCDQTYTCQSGTCTGSNPVVCTAEDQCHVAGTCSPSTGTCSNPNAANGTTCNDGNACTQTDTCEAGTCTGSNPVTCTAEDQCHVVGTCNPSTGTCSNPNAANGAICNDGNACMQTDTCQAGTCAGSNPVTCTAEDQCHVAGTCSPSTGTCSNPNAANGTTCNDGNACTQTDVCTAGTCTGTNPVSCPGPQPALVATGSMAAARSHHAACALATGDVLVTGGTPDNDTTVLATAETYHSGTGSFTSATPMNIARYGHTATTLQNGQVLVTGGTDSSGHAEATTEVYNPIAGTWTVGASMSAARSGHQAVLLGSGKVLVVGGAALGSPSSELYDPVAGTWALVATTIQSDGGPSLPTLPGGGPANVLVLLADGRVLAAGGYGTGSSSAPDPGASIYDPTTSSWTAVAPLPQGRAGTVGVLLPTGDVLVAGGAGSGLDGGPSVPLLSAVLYVPATNTWEPAGSMSVARASGAGAALPNGTVLIEGGGAAGGDAFDPFTATWSSVASPMVRSSQTVTPAGSGALLVAGGLGAGGNTLASAELFTALDAQCSSSSCNPQNGQCIVANKANGTSCSDGDACLQTQACQGGYCVGSNPVACAGSGPCQAATCDPTTGSCAAATVADGTSCNDGNLCISGETCQAGTCSGTATQCAPTDACNGPGTCDVTTGQCSNPPLADGTACPGSNPCFQTYACLSGACTGSTPVVCTASDQCHSAGTCDSSTGMCSNPIVADGTGCNDGNACTQTDVCQSGACTGSDPVTCTASDQCHTAGTCDPTSGACSNPAAANGTSCNDGNACTQTDVCTAGVCTGTNPVACTSSDQCHAAGTCEPSTGACTNPTATDGTMCAGTNPCDQTYACLSGTCTGSNPVVCTASDACHVAGVCDPTSGACSNPAAANGTTCNDGNACTQTDVCMSGACTGSNPVTCQPPSPQIATTSSMLTARSQHAATQLATGDVLVTGGTTNAGSTSLSTTEVFHLSTSTWASAATMNSPRYGHTETLLPSGQLLVAGGIDNGTTLATAELYNPSQNVWTRTGPMASPRYQAQAVALPNGEVLVVGGGTGSALVPEFFNPTTGTWARAQIHGQPPGIGAGNVVTVLGNGSVLVVGGNAGEGASTGASLYNPQTGTWTSAASMLEARAEASGALLPTGEVLLAGGVTGGEGEGGTSEGLSNAVFYNPTANSWIPAGTMSAPRAQGAAALLPNGTFFFNGGGASGADIYSPITGQWSAIASSTNRILQTATQTGSGAILVAGGLDPNGNTLSSAELFSAPDASCTQTSCNPQSGQCTTTNDANGSECSTGSACFLEPLCQTGYCVPNFPVTCPPSTSACLSSTCNPATGACGNVALPNGSACQSSDLCLLNTTCQAGTCTGAPINCAPAGPCEAAATCEPSTGTCIAGPISANGTPCTGSNLCDQTYTCENGSCAGSNPVVCTAEDQCHVAGACNSSTGVCSNPTVTDGTACTGTNLCDQSYACVSGTCTGSNPVVCAAEDQCHVAGTCNSSTGVCSNPTVPDGTACTGSNLCDQSYACVGGTCTGANPVVCTAPAQCYTASTCDPSTGACSSPVAEPNGASCDDGNPCTDIDLCTSGVCAGTAVANGTSCSDGNPCTTNDVCTRGVCAGTPGGCDAGGGGNGSGEAGASGVDAGNVDATTGDANADASESGTPAQPPTWPAGSVVTAAPTGPTSVKLAWTAASDPVGVTGYEVFDNGNLVATVSGAAQSYFINGLTSGQAYTFTVQAGNATGAWSTNGPTTAAVAQVPVLSVASPPPLDQTVGSSVASIASFLYSGPNAVQLGLQTTLNTQQLTVLQGRVLNSQGTALQGVAVTVAGHPEYGYTVSRADGHYDLAVNGGGTVTLSYDMSGMLHAERSQPVTWATFVHVPDVALVAEDPQVTQVDLSGGAPMQVARGSQVQDSWGTRTATIMIGAGTTAQMTMPDGQSQPITSAHIRATEYTVGSNGPAAMPAELPATSGYTYAASFTIDEEDAAQATRVTFSQPVAIYLENFLNMFVGVRMPVGRYDSTMHSWMPSTDGRVVQVLSTDGGTATLDVDGQGQPATASEQATLGITSDELAQVAALYSAGQTLWRVQAPHFSQPFDFNQGTMCQDSNCCAANEGACVDGIPKGGGGGGDCDHNQPGCIIDVEAQVLGEQVAVGGTPYTLNYRSEREPGYIGPYVLNIPLTGATPPPSLQGVQLEVDVAGEQLLQNFGTSANQQYTYQWDGNDGYGRPVQGQQPVTVKVGYVYDLVYLAPADNPLNLNPNYNAEFGHYTYFGTPATTTGRQITLWYTWNGTLGDLRDSPQDGLGGWTLSGHNLYDPASETVFYGDGHKRTADTLPAVATTIAGQPNNANCDSTEAVLNGECPLGDGQPASQVGFSSLNAIAAGPDGTVYICDGGNARIRAIAPNGIITTVAGGDPSEPQCAYMTTYEPDSLPAACRVECSSITVGTDGTLYFIESVYNNDALRRISNGLNTRIAISSCFSSVPPNGVPAATACSTGAISSIGMAPDGTIYLLAGGSLLRLTTDGYIWLVLGRTLDQPQPPSGVPLSSAYLISPSQVAVGNDGSVFISDSSFIRKISGDGIFSTVAGSNSFGSAQGSAGDGQAATSAAITPTALAVDPSGTIVFFDDNSLSVRAVHPDGVIETIAGNGSVNYPLWATGTNLATGVSMANTQSLAIAPDGTILVLQVGNSTVTSGVANAVSRIEPAVAGSPVAGFTIASEDGASIDVFDGSGRQLWTQNTLTGATTASFGYDSAGRLTSVTDVDGNVTSIQRDGSGSPTSIVGPYGQATVLAVDASGNLSSIQDAAGDTYSYAYGAGGLLQTTVTPRGGLYQYSYDPYGRLLQDVDPAGGGSTLTLAGTAAGNVVTRTTAMGVASSYEIDNLPSTDVQQIVTGPDGLTSTFVQGHTGTNTQTTPDGTTTTWTLSADPRFGMQSPITSSMTVETPSGLTSTSGTTQTVTLSNPSDLLSLLTQTTTHTLNGNAWTTVFNAAQLTKTTTSPVGRQVVTTIDSAGRPVQIATPNTTPFTFSYDSHGRLVTTTQGTRTWTQSYDALGNLGSTTDPLGHVTSYLNDAVGRPVTTTLADGRPLGQAYDPDSNLTSLTLPSSDTHGFNYTPVDLLSTYAPPSLGAGTWATQYAYDLDRRPTLQSQPDGVSIASAYDGAGRLATLTTPQGVRSYGYSATTGQLISLLTAGGEKLAYNYNGFLRTGVTWSGPVAGSLTLGFDDNFRMTSQVVNGVSLPFGYDADGLLTQAAAEQITLDPNNGRLTGTTLGSVTDAYTYDTDGLFASYVAQYAGNPVYSESVLRDASGRITQKTEIIGSTTHVWDYTFDVNGRLTDVTEDGQFASHYGYDADDNRTTFTNTSGTVNPTYDAQDRLLTYGTASYTYTANGELTSQTNRAGTTSYAYDSLGNLLNVGLPSSEAIAYVVDGENRRVGKQLNGTLTQGFLYKDALNVVVQLNGSGNVVNRFVFGSKPNVPDYFTSSAGTFRILSDHLGSPRLIVNTANGSVAEEIDYDEFGNVTDDTSPGLTPFGFAGGLYDKDTGLVRFGARDYDASVGRWTSKDPIRFAGGMNLYGYVVNDPVDGIDPTGTIDICQGNPTCIGTTIAICLEICGPFNPACYNSCVGPFVGPNGGGGGGGDEGGGICQPGEICTLQYESVGQNICAYRCPLSGLIKITRTTLPPGMRQPVNDVCPDTIYLP